MFCITTRVNIQCRSDIRMRKERNEWVVEGVFEKREMYRREQTTSIGDRLRIEQLFGMWVYGTDLHSTPLLETNNHISQGTSSCYVRVLDQLRNVSV